MRWCVMFSSGALSSSPPSTSDMKQNAGRRRMLSRAFGTWLDCCRPADQDGAPAEVAQSGCIYIRLQEQGTFLKIPCFPLLLPQRRERLRRHFLSLHASG